MHLLNFTYLSLYFNAFTYLHLLRIYLFIYLLTICHAFTYLILFIYLLHLLTSFTFITLTPGIYFIYTILSIYILFATHLPNFIYFYLKIN
jgi:hypothetical protein